MSSLIRTVIVDDSAFVRKVVREMLSCSPFIDVVGAARDGEEALVMVAELQPDVVTCDLTMPRLDGVEFVRRQMAAKPLPILMLTASPQDCEGVIAALEAGAVDFVRKPTASATDELRRMKDELLEKVKALPRAHALRLPANPAKRLALTPRKAGKTEIVVIGISTGGPQALRYLLPQFPAELPVPMAVVLHMPVGYTARFAESLNAICSLEVLEAGDGQALAPGKLYLGRAGQHLHLQRSASGQVCTRLSLQPFDKPHRPSVDVLFQSAAEIYGSRVLAVVMTGMGDDGKEGAARVKAQGGTVLTESEESCVIYGMPRVVVDSGLSDARYPLTGMAQGIVEHL